MKLTLETQSTKNPATGRERLQVHLEFPFQIGTTLEARFMKELAELISVEGPKIAERLGCSPTPGASLAKLQATLLPIPNKPHNS